MIRGCAKNVIVVKNTGGELFDEAYFIVKPGRRDNKKSDFMTEVNRIISSEGTQNAKKKHFLSGSVPFAVLGFFSGAVSAATVILLILIS